MQGAARRCESGLPDLRVMEFRGEHVPEGVAVAREALLRIGDVYGVRRELSPGVLDCSTLVSQSMWVGAGVRTPFRAEMQRTDPLARAVNWTALTYGDLAFRYESAADSPGGSHNHVAMYVGTDRAGDRWCVESSETRGVILTPLEPGLHQGGFRRFCPRPDVSFPTRNWQPIARSVPKLGRLGCRLTAATPTHHRLHLGTDIVIKQTAPIVAPVSGVITRIMQGSGTGCFLEIESPCPSLSVQVMGPIAGLCRIVGDAVARGEFLGISSADYVHGCNVLRHLGHSRLHWESWGLERCGGLGHFDLRFSNRGTAIGQRDRRELLAQNPVYLVKRGLLHNPVPGLQPL